MNAMNLSNIGKSFTRFFIPGIAFSFFVILVPIILMYGLDLFGKHASSINASIFLPLSLLVGYILDNIKLYKYNFDYPNYNEIKKNLVEQMSEAAANKNTTDNPDDLLVHMWLSDNETYERIFQDRAVWVMIHTTSSVMILSGIICTIILTYKSAINNQSTGVLWLIPICFIFVSWLSTITGSKEKLSHHKKLIKAISDCKQISENTPIK
jgi:hypothetical protein